MQNYQQNKHLFLFFVKVSVLFVSGLYLLGFVWFPLMGFGNYVLINVDFLLPSEWVFLTIIGIGEIVWSIKLILKFYLNTVNNTQ